MEVKNKVVIVTGASEGIGLATARLLSQHGATVVLSARNSHKLQALERELPNTVAIPADMKNPDDIKSLVDQTVAKFGRVDILINNAGQALYGPLHQVSLDEFESIVELNIFGPLRAMQAVIPYMKKQGGGAIINVSSGTSKMVLPNAGAYAATKAAMNMLSLVARQELEAENIIVSVIYPYITAAKLGENAFGREWRPVSSNAVSKNLPPPHSAEHVASEIIQLIASGEAEKVLTP